MADRALMAFLKNALSVNTTTNPQEQTALQDLIFSRLLTGNWQISSTGVVSFNFSATFADGTVNAPSIAFLSEPNTGRYRIGATNVGESIGGTKVFDWNASRLNLVANLIFTADNTFDIGAAGATRPRDFFLGRNANIAGTLGVSGATTLSSTLHQVAAATFDSTASFAGAVTLSGGLNTPLASAQGGTGSGFFAIAGPSVLRTFTLPDASTTVLTTNAAVTVAQGGTGVATLTNHGVVIGQAASNVAVTSAGTSGQVLMSNGAAADPTFQAFGAAQGAGMVLLEANNGSSNSTGTNVALDSIVLPVLTALDELIIEFEATVGAGITTAGLTLRHVTDGANLYDFSNSVNMNTGEIVSGRVKLAQDQQGNTKINVDGAFQNSAHLTNSHTVSQYSATATWVSGWTLSLNINGQTSGSTKWRWSVYRKKGQ